jgi:hypothetical protein
MKHKIYLGLREGLVREVFRSTTTEPTRQEFPQYLATVGPFRTVRGARFMRDFGMGNPHCQCVRDAERLGKKYNA